MSLNGATTTVSSNALGTPGQEGSVRGNLSRPAASRGGAWLNARESWKPWQPPSHFMTLSLPVQARARRTAACVASLPELTKPTFSTPGTAATILRATSYSSSCGSA